MLPWEGVCSILLRGKRAHRLWAYGRGTVRARMYVRDYAAEKDLKGHVPTSRVFSAEWLGRQVVRGASLSFYVFSYSLNC